MISILFTETTSSSSIILSINGIGVPFAVNQHLTATSRPHCIHSRSCSLIISYHPSFYFFAAKELMFDFILPNISSLVNWYSLPDFPSSALSLSRHLTTSDFFLIAFYDEINVDTHLCCSNSSLANFKSISNALIAFEIPLPFLFNPAEYIPLPQFNYRGNSCTQATLNLIYSFPPRAKYQEALTFRTFDYTGTRDFRLKIPIGITPSPCSPFYAFQIQFIIYKHQLLLIYKYF